MDPSANPPKNVAPAAAEATVDYVPAPGGGVAPSGAVWTADPAALVGQHFGDFEVLALLGRGGMGAVYKARQKSLDRLVALKVLLDGPDTKSSLRERFLAEARAGAALAHPNIPTIYQTGDCPAGPYCAMEYIDGQTLADVIRGRTVSVASAVALVCRVAEAVPHAHTKGIIHRDLKPGNIMIDKGHRPVVMDFGLAKLLEKPTGLTKEGEILGTPGYMPPEQARGDPSRVGRPSDVYSLGAILYHLLAGRPPYNERTPFETILKVLAPEPPRPPRDFRPEIPPGLEQICLKCLRKDPAQRYPTAGALTVELRRFRTANPDQKRGPATMRPMALEGFLLMTWTKGQVPLAGGSLVMGREPGCDLELPALTVSGRHCRIQVDAEQHVVEVIDLGSAGGTRVNGQAVKRRRLQDGDQLDVGGYLFRVQLMRPKAPTAAQPGG